MLWTHDWFYFTVWKFFLYEKCLYRDTSCAKRWHLILPVNWNLCLGPKYAGWDSLSNGMLLSFNQATTMVLFSWSWHMTWFLVWCRINRPWIHSEIPNGGWTGKCWMWWRGYGRVVVTMQAWSIEEMWELEISLNNFLCNSWLCQLHGQWDHLKVRTYSMQLFWWLLHSFSLPVIIWFGDPWNLIDHMILVK
jgi:hypothetical protein